VGETRTLLLLRHAKSSWDDTAVEDFDRGLAPRGERAAAAVGVWLRQQGLRPDLALCSPAERTARTLAIVLDQCARGDGSTPAIRYDRELYHADGEQIAERIAEGGGAHRCVLVVGHHPGLAETALRLARGPRLPRARIEEKFPTGGLARLCFEGAWHELGPGTADIESFIVPKELM